MGNLSTNLKSDYDILYKLNKEINRHETNRDEKAKDFFKTYLYNDFGFIRASGICDDKKKFIEKLDEPDPVASRKIKDLVIERIETNHAIVSCIVIGKTKKDEEIKYYRNTRAFKKENKTWFLHAWYNYEIENLMMESYTNNRMYNTNNLDSFFTDDENAKDDKEVTKRIELSKFLYTEICNSWKQLVEVRFKLLALVPSLSVLGLASIFKTGDFDALVKLVMCLLGFVAVFAAHIYDLRNTQLHNDLIGRGRKIESELGFMNGHFMGRLDSYKYLINSKRYHFFKLQHDLGLKMIYCGCLIAWLLAIVYSILKGIGII